MVVDERDELEKFIRNEFFWSSDGMSGLRNVHQFMKLLDKYIERKVKQGQPWPADYGR